MEIKNNKNKWKTRAIVVLVLLVLSWALFISLIAVGMNIEDKELECSVNVCGENVLEVAYEYDITDDVCYCYDQYNKVVENKFIK